MGAVANSPGFAFGSGSAAGAAKATAKMATKTAWKRKTCIVY